MDIIRDLIQTSNASRSRLRIVNNNGILGVVTNSETTPTLPTEISVTGASIMPTEISVVGASSTTIGTTERVISFPYSGTAATKDYTFTTTENLICDILVIGGGGAGGKRHGGGGGAGTLLYHKNITLNGTYNIKVGKGGTGVPSTGFASGNTVLATSGNFSQFIKSDSSQEYYANGGGRGGGWSANSLAITNGGRTFSDSDTTLPLTNKFNGATVSVVNKNYVNTLTSPEGCRGNIGGLQVTNYKGGGGGGAGGVGMNHDAETTVNDGYGGLGLAVDITGTSVVYAGGGNGSDFSGSVSQVFDPSYPTIQSRGGGGFGSDTGTGQNGLDGTGGGGGGQGNDADGFPSGNGGSGIVIIRYRKVPSEIVVSSTIAGTTDRYISFPYSGTGTTKDYTITTTEALSCDILIVGGGGGGGISDAGGGGAGACIVALNQSFAAGNYTVRVGNGGIGGILSSTGTITRLSTDGVNSSILNSSSVEIYRAVGGGRAGGFESSGTQSEYVGKTGGCGGGAGFWQGNTGVSGGAVSSLNIINDVSNISPSISTTYGVYGNVGGSSTYWNNSYGNANAGGGGGIGVVGSNGVLTRSGAGGNGLAQVTINSTLINFKTYFAPDWASFGVLSGGLFYIGGGGGGGGYANANVGAEVSGGLGGGGTGDQARVNADYTNAPSDGIANTGSGGGGACGNAGASGGNGGSGIIIIRYRKATNTVSNTIFSISNGGVISTSTNVYSNVIINYVDTLGTSNTGISSLWTSSTGTIGSGTNIYYNTSNVGIGTLDPVAPLHIYNNIITPLPTEISVVGATGGIIGTTERVISFPYSGSATTKDYTFTTTEALICDILIVGGGGGGGDGGGGGGGYVYLSNLNMAVGSYSVSVGNGGNGGGAYTQGSQGASSTFILGGTTYIAYGGGGGGGTGTIAPAHTIGQVGSYGGNGVDSTVVQTYTSSQGNRGGSSITGYFGSGGGGGGAGGVGGVSVYVSGILAGTGYTYSKGGQGGNGLPNSITGTEIYYAGGGTAGANTDSGTDTSTQIPPIGGGGIGSRAPNAVGGNGVDGTGGGGGGGDPHRTSATGKGGSGIIIIRYRLQTVVSNARLLLDTTTTGMPSIEFRRGVGADMQNDYRLINDTSPANGTIKLLCENSTQSFNDTTANLAWFSSNETIIHKNTSMNGRVGIGTTYHATNATRRLDVLGDANISGQMNTSSLSVAGNSSSGVSAIITNSLTSNTSLTIQNSLIVSSSSITSSPSSTITGITGVYTYQVFTYTTETGGTGTGQSLYTITTTGTIQADILVIGGGGGGGDGGGGGGGYVYTSNLNISAGTYSVRVGNGGNGGSTWSQGSQGFSSSIIGGSLNYIAYGGGGGGGTGATAPSHTTGQVGSYGGNGTNNSGNIWTLVRRVPAGLTKWHPTTDGLVGTVVYGTYSSNPQNNNIGTGWSINFENAVPGYNQFRFATGDEVVWLITTKAAIGGAVVSPAQYYSDNLRAIVSSSDSATPYSARWYYRSVGSEDPWISVIDHGSAVAAGKILYGQNSFGAPHANVLNQRIGANVFVRNTNMPTTIPVTQTYTSTQGNRGGTTTISSYGSGGGGGGAGGIGGNADFASSGVIAGAGLQYYRGGTGGNGVLNSITGENIYYAGGGTGGANTNQGTDTTTQVAPLGGGGIGSRAPGAVGGNGVNGTGGGGGGGDPDRTSASGRGGSGIVIIRYLSPISTSSSIELIRGTAGDANRDYKIGNYNAEFKVISSTSGVDTDYIKITTAGAITNPTGTANWNTGSDRRIKENIVRASYDKCYENISKLELNRFNYIDGFNTVSRDRSQLGFIAQEVKDIFPKSISTQGYYTDTLNIPDLLSIDITQINYSLYGAVKKLIEINKEDKDKLASLDNRIKTITNFLNISFDASDITIDTSNLLDTSNIAIDTSNLLDTSNIAIDTSNLLDTSNIAIDTSNLLDTSNIAIDTSNLLDTSNIAIDTSNIAIDTSNLLDTSSNISIE